MTEFFNKFKKSSFWPIFGPFSLSLGQKKFSWKIQLFHAQLHMGFQHHAKIQKKLMIQFKENAWTDGRMWKDGWKDRQTSFYRTLPASTRVSKYNQQKLNAFYSFIFQRKIIYTATDSNVLKIKYFLYFLLLTHHNFQWDIGIHLDCLLAKSSNSCHSILLQ